MIGNQQLMQTPTLAQPQPQSAFGQVQYSEEEERVTAIMLQRKLGSEYISKRSGPGGSSVSYLESNKAIELANKVFGFNGWSITIVHMNLDYLDHDAQNRFSVGLSCVARVTLKDGTFREVVFVIQFI
jgi:DNA repair and recombination protein RAD52